MKRIKVAHNQFLELLRLESDSGSTAGFEIIKLSPKHPRSFSFPPNDWINVATRFIVISDILKTTGLPLRYPKLRRWIDRSVNFSARIRPSER